MDIIKALLSLEKLNHRIRDGRGRSVLLSAIALENIPLLHLLLEYDMNHEREKTNNQGDDSTLLLLEYDSGNRTYLYLACCSKNEDIVRTLLKYEPNRQINRKNKDQEQHAPLHAAVTRGDPKLCRIQYGSAPDASCSRDCKGTAVP